MIEVSVNFKTSVGEIDRSHFSIHTIIRLLSYCAQVCHDDSAAMTITIYPEGQSGRTCLITLGMTMWNDEQRWAWMVDPKRITSKLMNVVALNTAVETIESNIGLLLYHAKLAEAPF